MLFEILIQIDLVSFTLLSVIMRNFQGFCDKKSESQKAANLAA